MGVWADATPGLVVLPDGRRVRGRGLRRDATDPAQPPEFGLYLSARAPQAQPWETRWVRWPDFRLPADVADTVAAVREAYERSATQRVELACGGGVGRTGTALALLARLAGVPPAQAVAWVREHYRRRAVETRRQRRFVQQVTLR